MSQPSSESITPFNSDLFIGTVFECRGSSMEVSLGEPGQEKSDTVSCLAGDFILVRSDDFGIFGQVLGTSQEKTETATTAQTFAQIELLHSIDFRTGSITVGLTKVPQVGARVYAAHPAIVKAVTENRASFNNGHEGVALNIARIRSTGTPLIQLSPERMFGRHCAVLGNTGAGKSWTVSKILEECSRHHCKVILFDATGEYHALSKHVHHVILGKGTRDSKERGKEVALPYYHLKEEDLFAIFRPSGPSQAPKLRAAMKSLKLARLAPRLAPDGTIIKAHKAKQHFQEGYNEHLEEIEGQEACFDIKKLARQIQNECVDPDRSPMEPHYWGGPNGIDLSNCVALITRINDVVRSENLAPIFQPHGAPSLFDELNNFLESKENRILRISLESLSFSHHAREIVANALARRLLRFGRSGTFKKTPLLVFVDEAHQFLNPLLSGENELFPLDSFELIAKEGRKYALNICLATQRPRDLPEGILSQMGTLVVHRLIDDRDRHVIERASGELNEAARASIPSLSPGHAIIVGADFSVPLPVQIEPPEAKPDSAGPNYQKYWKG